MIELNAWKRVTLSNDNTVFFDLPLFQIKNNLYFCFEYRKTSQRKAFGYFQIFGNDQLVIGKSTKKEPISRRKILSMIFTEKNLPSLE